MAVFQLNFQLCQDNLIFTLDLTPQSKTFTFNLSTSQIQCRWLTLQYLYSALQAKTASLYFCIEDLQICIQLTIGQDKRAIYIPFSSKSNQIQALQIELIQAIDILMTDAETKLFDVENKAKQDLDYVQQQTINLIGIYGQSQRSIQQTGLLLASNQEEILKMSRQLLIIDQEILNCKRGFQLEQYRAQTSKEQRLQRKRMVYLSEVSKLQQPKAEQALRDLNQTKKDVSSCELRTMRFVELFPQVQELVLSNNSIRKMEGMTSLSELRKLDLSGNWIERLEGLNNNLQLRQLLMQRNKITKMQNIFHLPRLQIIALSDNCLEEVPAEVKVLTTLIELRLINNAIITLSWELLCLTQLRTLSLLGNPCFREGQKAKELINRLVENQVQTCNTIF